MTAIDIFAGCGGTTTGARAADIKVLWAANHAPLAVWCHSQNHPEAVHSCQDLNQADFDATPDHDVLLGSPDCRGHTRARGKEKPRHDKYRSTAWAVVSCIEAKRPAAALIENVPDFLKWTLFPAWSHAINRLGYTISPHIVDSADHGVPQSRIRAYLILTRSKGPLYLQLPHKPHVPVSSIIDWESKNGWTNWHTLCDRTVARLTRGQIEFGSRFVAPYYGHGWCRSIHRPIGTITTRDRWQIVDGDRARFLSVDECRKAMGFPAGYVLPQAKQSAKLMLGQAVCPPVITDLLLSLKAQL